MLREEEVEELERRFPELAFTAFAQARARALDAGLSVVETYDALLMELGIAEKTGRGRSVSYGQKGSG